MRQEGEEMNRESLKSLLINYLEENPAGAIRETAEKILNKITGFQLLGMESGPMLQISLQLPIMLGQKMVDLTMQWSGKNKRMEKLIRSIAGSYFISSSSIYKKRLSICRYKTVSYASRSSMSMNSLNASPTPFIEALKGEPANDELYAYQRFSLRGRKKRHPGILKVHGAPIFDKSQYTGVDIRI